MTGTWSYFATYHLWVRAVNSNRWHTRDTQNNTALDGTFVYNNSRVVYNALPLYSGSPWHRTNSTTGPAGPNRVDYEMNFPDDEPLLGSTDFVLNNPGNPDVLTVSDQSALAEQTVYHIFQGLGLPHNHPRYIHFFVNGSQRSTALERPGNFIFEDSQQPNGEMIEQWFPNNPAGQLFKLEDWFEFEDNAGPWSRTGSGPATSAAPPPQPSSGTPLPIGSLPEIPCASCHERIPGLAWGARCNACHARRVRRASQLARRISLLAAVVTAVVLRFVIPPGPDARMVFGIGTLGAFLTVRVIVKRVGLEYLPD